MKSASYLLSFFRAGSPPKDGESVEEFMARRRELPSKYPDYFCYRTGSCDCADGECVSNSEANL